MLGIRNPLQTIKHVKTAAGAGDLRRVLGGFGKCSGNVLHVVAVPMCS